MATVKTPRMAFRQVIRLLLLFLMVLWFPVLMNYMSVFLIIEGSARGILTFSFFFWLAWVLFALVLGRAGCGWTCPLGAFQETGDRMVPKDLVKVKRLRVIKYFFAVGWVGAIVAAISSTGGTGNINLLYKTESGISATTVENWLTWGSIVLVVLMPTFFMGRRAFCHYFCPWGVLNIEMTSVRNRLHLPGLRLKGDPQKCKKCRTCLANCPMSLSVGDMIQSGSVQNTECILCGTCVDNCPNKAVEFSWRRIRSTVL